MNDGAGGFLFLVVCVAIYVLPCFVAQKRRHRNANAIMALDILAGWTVAGWIIAMVWSLTDNVKTEAG